MQGGYVLDPNPPVGIRSVSEISDAVVASMKHNGIVVAEANIAPEFFELRSGFAGEVLQKFANYRARLAIVLSDDPHAHGERFGELVHEHRAHAVIRFFRSEEDARRWLRESTSTD
jgi:hypothetical protein